MQHLKSYSWTLTGFCTLSYLRADSPVRGRTHSASSPRHRPHCAVDEPGEAGAGVGAPAPGSHTAL
eukprot:3225305-Pyramimonas_sp.AAC.1